MKKLWMLALFLLLAAAAAGLYLNEKKPPASYAPPAAQRYVAAEGKVETLPGYDLNLSTGELNAKVSKILVREGETVTAGQLIAVLENDDLRAQVGTAERELAVAESRLKEVESGARREEILQAKAALEGTAAGRDEAERQFQRYRDLRAQGMVAASALDERERSLKLAEAQMEEAKQRKLLLEAGPKPETVKLYRNQVTLARAALEHSRRLLDKTLIHSPIAGTVIKRYLDAGEGITPEIPILAIADLNHIWINAEVDETDIGKVQVGDSVTISSDAYRGTFLKGRVRQIANYAGERKVRPNDPSANLGLKVVQVKIELDQPSPLRLGMTVDVKISPTQNRGANSQ